MKGKGSATIRQHNKWGCWWLLLTFNSLASLLLRFTLLYLGGARGGWFCSLALYERHRPAPPSPIRPPNKTQKKKKKTEQFFFFFFPLLWKIMSNIHTVLGASQNKTKTKTQVSFDLWNVCRKWVVVVRNCEKYSLVVVYHLMVIAVNFFKN
jgi:hypothetical protein